MELIDFYIVYSSRFRKKLHCGRDNAIVKCTTVDNPKNNRTFILLEYITRGSGHKKYGVQNVIFRSSKITNIVSSY